MMVLAAEHCKEKTVLMDTTYLKARRTVTVMGVKKAGVDV